MPKSNVKKKKTAKKPKKPIKKQLTGKQMRFCEEYVIDNNATKAAIRAGYSKKTAGSVGSENLKKPEIQKQILRLQKEIAEKAEITRDGLLSELKKIGFINIDFDAVPEKDKLVLKLKAIDTIARMLGLEHPDFSGEIEDLTDTESDIFG